MTRQSTFPPDEQPTEPTSVAAQVAIVAANMKAMTPERRKRLVRYSAALAALPAESPPRPR